MASGSVRISDPASPGADAARAVRRTPSAAMVNPRAFYRRRRLIDRLLRWGTPVALIVAWQVVSGSGLLDRMFWPAPSDVVVAFGESIAAGLLLDAASSSLVRILIGFLCGATAGVVLGFALGSIRRFRIALDPIISALYTVPKLAVLPLLLLVFGIGEAPKVILVAFGVFFIVVIATTAAVNGVSEAYLEPARSFGAGRMQTFRHVIGPSVLPEVFTALRIAIGNAILLMIGVEFVQGRDGLGFLIWNSWQLFLADRMYVGIVTTALVGVVLQVLVMWIGRRLAPWSDAGR